MPKNDIKIQGSNGQWFYLGEHSPRAAADLVAIFRNAHIPYELTMHVRGRCPFYND